MQELMIGSLSFQLGKPWMMGEGSLGVAVPITRSEYQDRNYVTLEEAGDKVKVSDTGNIGRLDVSSGHDMPVFVRSGSVFRGEGTQSRGSNFSFVVVPKIRETIQVSCVHASHPIMRGSQLRHCSRSSPSMAHSAMLESYMGGTQGKVWDSVRSARHGAKGRYWARRLRTGAPPMTDDLSGNIQKMDGFLKDIDRKLLGMPNEEGQVGMAVLDMSGVAGLEIFDHPRSWKSIREDVIKKHRSVLMDRQDEPLFRPDLDAVPRRIVGFVNDLFHADGVPVFRGSNSETILLDSGKLIGEYTRIGDRTVHLVAMRK